MLNGDFYKILKVVSLLAGLTVLVIADGHALESEPSTKDQEATGVQLKELTFSWDEWFADPPGNYQICLGGMRKLGDRTSCVRLEGLSKKPGTTLPLQVFIETREGSAISNLEAVEAWPRVARVRGGGKLLETSYTLDPTGTPEPYRMPERSKEHEEWDALSLGIRKTTEEDGESRFYDLLSWTLVFTLCFYTIGFVRLIAKVDEKSVSTSSNIAYGIPVARVEDLADIGEKGKETKNQKTKTISTTSPDEIKVEKNKRKVIL